MYVGDGEKREGSGGTEIILIQQVTIWNQQLLMVEAHIFMIFRRKLETPLKKIK